MSDKKGWSEEKTDIFGNTYTQHYDEDGNKAGYSEEKTGIFGDHYTQHYDQSGNKTEYSEERTGIFGDEYTQHHDQSGSKTGWSEDRTDIFGDEYTQHHDQSGSKTGWSEERTGIFGDEYTQHYGRGTSSVGSYQKNTSESSRCYRSSSSSSYPDGYSSSSSIYSKSTNSSSNSSLASCIIGTVVFIGVIAILYSALQNNPAKNQAYTYQQSSSSKNISQIKKYLFGTWRFKHGITEYKNNSKAYTKYENGDERISNLHIDNDRIVYTFLRFKKKGHRWVESKKEEYIEYIVYIDESNLTVKNKSGNFIKGSRVKTQASMYSQYSPPAEVIVPGACPFEGCQYGKWTALKNIPIYSNPGGTMLKRSIGRGQVVTAVSGEVRAMPRKATVIRVDKSDIEQGINVGSAVYLLYPLGEGAIAVWHEGKVKEGSLDIDFHYDHPGNSLHWTWWARVRLADGTTGWVKSPQNHFNGTDRFGGE